jgi:hypothetical protein
MGEQIDWNAIQADIKHTQEERKQGRLTTWDVVAQIAALQPGQRIEFNRHALRQLMTLPGWTIEEYIMEKIMGSPWIIRYRIDEQNHKVIYSRLKLPLGPESGLRTYVSPDRRHFYRETEDGLWELRDVMIVDEQRFI